MTMAAQNTSLATRLATRLDYSYRVLDELNLQLGQLRQRTIAFVDTGDEQSRIELSGFVKKIAQTLELINCKGARLLTQELYLLLNAMADDQVVDGIDAAPVLVLASEKLSEYLDYLRVGGLDIPLALLPLLNDMRACRGESLLSEALIVSPVFEIPETSDALVRGDSVAAEFFRVIRETKLPLMQCVLRWLRNHTVSQNLRKLVKLLDSLEQTSPSAALQDLWLAARALCVSMLDGSLEDSVAIRVLFGQMERFVSQLSEADFQSSDTSPDTMRTATWADTRDAGLLRLPSGLFKNMLYYIALSRSTDERVTKMQQSYRLNELLPPRAMLDSARDALGGPNAQLSDAICASIGRELSEIKSAVSGFSGSVAIAPTDVESEQLRAGAHKLEQVASTFLLLGIQGADNVARSASRRLDALGLSEGSAAIADDLPALASELLQLEAAIEEYRHAASTTPVFADTFARDMLEQRRLSSFQFDQIVAACLGEARDILGNVEIAYLASINEDKIQAPIREETRQAGAVDEPRMQWQRSRLVDAAEQLHTVKMALQILPLPELEPLLGGAARYLLASAKSTATISEHLHIAFADLMVNTQTYLDAQIQRQSSASDLLGSAELALDTLYDAMDTIDSSDSTVGLASTLEVSAASMADAHNSLAVHSQPLSAQDSPMIEVFTAEALEQFELINQSLVRWQDNADPFALQDLRRSYHTLKGSGYVAGATALADFAAAHETMLGSVIDHAVDVPQQVDDLMHESAAVLPQLIYSMQSDDDTVEGVAELNARLYSVASGISAGSGISHGGMQDTSEIAEGQSEFHEHTLALGMVADELAQTSVIDVPAGLAAAAFMPTANGVDEHDKTQDLSEVLDQRFDSQRGLHSSSSVALQGLSPGESEALSGDLSDDIPGDMLPELYDDETLQLDSAFEQNPLDAGVQRSAMSSQLDQSADVTQQISSAFTAASPVPPQAGVGFDNNSTLRDAEQEHEFTWSDNVDPDSTLFRVFETETRTHLGTLRRVLDYALRQDSPSVPDELLPRTLHTMHGSARAAEVEAIASLVSPLEEIAAYRLRTGRVLELSQWTRFAEVVDAIEHNLDVLADGPVALNSTGTHAGVGIVSAEQLGLQDLQQPSMTPTAGPRTDLAEVFLLEAAGLFETIQHSVNELENNQHEQTTQGVEKIILRDILRPLHTLKGSARVSGCNEIADLAHVLESSLLSWQDSERGADQKRRDLLQESIDALTLNLEQAAANATQGHFDLLINELNRDVTDSEQSVYTDEMPEELTDESFGQTLQLHGDLLGSGFVEPDDMDAATSANGLDKIRAVYKQGQPDFELTAELPVADTTMRSSDDAVAPLLRPPSGSGQTGATESKVSGNDVASTKNPGKTNGQVRLDAQLLDNLSSLSTDVSLHHVQLSDGLFAFRDTLTDLDKTTSRLREKLRELDMETDMLPDSTLGDAGSEQSRLSAEELERTVHFNPLLPDAWQRTEEDSRQLSEILSDLDNIRDTMHSQLRLAEETLSHTSRLGSDIHESLLRSRLVRFDLHLHRLGSVVRQTARSVGRQAELELLGGQTAIDRDMHNALLVPLEHLLRNAVSHGIEKASVREKKNKSSSGKIAINVSITGSDLCIDVSDDGAGIDYAALRRTLTLPGATEQELHLALFQPGFSTAQQATQISGRGIGLDSTRAAVTALGGRLELSSQLDAGTRIRIRIPQRVVINQVVLVESDGNLFGIPVNFVQQVLPVEPPVDSLAGAEAGTVAGPVAEKGSREYGGKSYNILGIHELPGFASLANSASKAQTTTAGQIEQEILIEASGQLLALRAGRVIGFRELITRPPGRQLSKLGFYSGVSVLASGQVALMLDLDRLLEFQFDQTLSLSPEHLVAGVGARVSPDIELMQQRLPGSSANPPATVGASATVLVVDDSVTMRTYAKRIIEGAGLQCSLARDGVEAMESLETTNLAPDVILLDIEMPRMDGFQLLQRLRETPALSQIPVIMISSRTGEANRQKATELGVVAYLGKPYQASELRTVLESRLKISCLSL